MVIAVPPIINILLQNQPIPIYAHPAVQLQSQAQVPGVGHVMAHLAVQSLDIPVVGFAQVCIATLKQPLLHLTQLAQLLSVVRHIHQIVLVE